MRKLMFAFGIATMFALNGGCFSHIAEPAVESIPEWKLHCVETGAINFESNSAELSTENLRRLCPWIEVMKDPLPQAFTTRIQIHGHTDNRERNRKWLSRRRAQNVAVLFINAGIDPAIIEVEGKGAQQPIAVNDSPEGRARNRRVDITPHVLEISPTTNWIGKPRMDFCDIVERCNRAYSEE